MHSTSTRIKSNFDRPVSLHDKQQTYTFERKPGKNKDQSSVSSSNFTNPEISRADKNDSPHDDLEDDHNPGPGAYKPERVGTMRAVFPSSPYYTISARHHDYQQSSTPDPGTYSIGGHFPDKSRAPSCGLSGKHSIYKAPFIVTYKK